MSLLIGKNISSLRATSRLSRTSDEMKTVFERLSSGMRINRAADDAAGLAIADGLRADARIYGQAIRNVNDGISLINIADGALNELTNITNRLKELAQQSANGTYTREQRIALDKEADTLTDEFNRIVESTEFNGIKILEDAFYRTNIQAGVGVENTLGITIGDSFGRDVGNGGFGDSIEAANFSGGQADTIEIGDFNGDGNIDAIIDIGANTRRLSLFLGNGDGTFQSGTEVYDGDTSDPMSLEIADFNGDSRLDFAVVEYNADIEIFLGDGAGGFTQRDAIGVAGVARENDSADLDGDGDLDFLVTKYSGNEVEIYSNDGTGDLTYVGTFETGDFIFDVDGADINNDGIGDIVAVGQTGAITVGLGNGDLTFTQVNDYSIAGAQYRDFELVDVDGDYNLDLVTINSNTSEVEIFIGNGQGDFALTESYDIGVSGTAALAMADINGDGELDIVSGREELVVLFSNGDGTFTQAATVDQGASTQKRDFQLGDINNDGVLDLLTVDFANEDFLVYIGDSTRVATTASLSLETQDGARQALDTIEALEQRIIDARSSVGAFEQRLNIANNVLQVVRENFLTAEGRIRNADIATESANLVKLAILQQAGAAVLSQANLQPSLVLELLSDL